MSVGRPGRLALARWEADRHAAVLDEALAAWRSMLVPPNLAAIEGNGVRS